MMLDISSEEYHQIDAIGSSSLIKAEKTLAHYKSYIDGLNEPTSLQKKTFELGTALHSCVLEQSIDNYIKCPHTDGRTKEYKQFVKDNSDKIVLKPDEYDSLSRAFNAIAEHSVAEPIISKADIEKSFVCEYQGLNLKARPDIVYLKDGVLYDYKTTTDVSIRKFKNKIIDLKYHIRLAHYAFVLKLEGYEIDRFGFIAQETASPNAINVFELNEADIKRAKEDHESLLNKVIVATKDDFWPAYSEEIQMIDLPEWAFLTEEGF